MKPNTRIALLFALALLALLALLVALPPAQAGCAAIYPNICTGPAVTASPPPSPTPTPCFPSGMCKGKAPFKPGTPPAKGKS